MKVNSKFCIHDSFVLRLFRGWLFSISCYGLQRGERIRGRWGIYWESRWEERWPSSYPGRSRTSGTVLSWSPPCVRCASDFSAFFFKVLLSFLLSLYLFLFFVLWYIAHVQTFSWSRVESSVLFGRKTGRVQGGSKAFAVSLLVSFDFSSVSFAVPIQTNTNHSDSQL